MTKAEAAPVRKPIPLTSQSQPGGDKHATHLLARNVRHFRTINNVTQEALADRCGIFRTYLSRIETGKCNPSLSVLVALAGALEIPPHVLLVPME